MESEKQRIKHIKSMYRDYLKNLSFICEGYEKQKNFLIEKYSGLNGINYNSIKNEPNYYNNDRLNKFSDEMQQNENKLEIAKAALSFVDGSLEDVFNSYKEENLDTYKIFDMRYRGNISISDIAYELKYEDQESTIYKKLDAGFKAISEWVFLMENISLESPFNEKLIEMRKMSRKNQRQMAQLFNISREHYNRIEKGAEPPTEEIIKHVKEFEKDFIDFLQ